MLAGLKASELEKDRSCAQIGTGHKTANLSQESVGALL